MNRFHTFCLMMSLSLAAPPAYTQVTANRLMPPVVNMRKQGWDVSLQTGNLTIGLPIAAVPGEVPVPVVFGLNATYLASTWMSRVYDPEIGKSVPVLNEIDRPMVGGVHFGYISGPATYSGTIVQGLTVLEDGDQIADNQWTTFSSNAILGTTLNLPQAYGFLAVSTSVAKVDPTATYLSYTTTASGLGATYQALVPGLMPSGFGSVNSSYKVVLDKNKARVYAYATTVQAWVPILWIDRFGHRVTFQWLRSTTSLPPGITAITKVTVMNQYSKGIILRWADFVTRDLERDILRLDFVGMNAPSVLITGYYGYSYLAPTGFVNTMGADNQWTVVPSMIGAVCRPKSIKTGAFGNLAQPSWSGSGSSASSAPIAPASDGTITATDMMNWTFTYDGNQAELASYLDPKGLTTAFTYANYPKTGLGNLVQPRGVSRVDLVDASQRKLRKVWTRLFPVDTTPPTVKIEGWWDPDLMATPERYHQFTFPATTDALNYGNGVHRIDSLMDTAGKAWSTTTYAYNSAGAGLNSSLSSVQSVSILQDGKSKANTSFGYQDSAKLQVTQRNEYWTDTAGVDYQLSSIVNTYAARWDMLVGQQLTQVMTTRYAEDGVTPLPSITQKFTYGIPKPGQPAIQLLQSYLDGGSDGLMGQTFSYDLEGRLKTKANYASFSLDGVATTTLTYGGDGLPSASSTAYSRPANQTGASSIGEGATYDNAGRRVTETDALGVQTTLTYDTFSRIRSQNRQGDQSITFTYPDPLTRTVTKGGQSTTELSDGLGRLVRRNLPDGRRIEPTYDGYGRVVAEREYSTNGQASRASVVSFDPLDRPTLVSSPSGGSTSYHYAIQYTGDGLGPNGQSDLVVTSVAGLNVSRTEYRHASGPLVKIKEPTGSVSTMAYDASGILASVTTKDVSGNTQIRNFKYNTLGLLTEKTEPETDKQTFSSFDAQGNPTVVSEGVGTLDLRARTILFDGLGRVCKVSSNTGNEKEEFYFDGALLAGADRGGPNPVSMLLTYKSTAQGRRLASESTTLGGAPTMLSYGYLSTGQLDTITYPSGRIVGYTYDTVGRISGIQDRTGGGYKAIVASLGLDEWGQRKRLTFGSGAYSDWTTQDLGTHLKDWTIGYTTGGLGDSANPRMHTYDLAERLTKAGEWQNIVHDSANRLGYTEAPSLGVNSITLNHDAFGNNITQAIAGTSAPSFNAFSEGAMLKNQMVAMPAGWVYNKRGEATSLNQGPSSSQALGLVWDALGRVKQVNTNFGSLQSYTYAPSGLRILVQDSAAAVNNRRYAYTSGGMLMSEFTDAGWKRDVVYLGSEAIAEIDNAGIHELHNDHLGTPRIVTNGGTAQIEGKQAYGPYGEYLQGHAAGYKPLTGYTGHLQNDPSGLIYMRGRFYSPSWHQFVNSDQGVDPNSWNQMGYVGGSPFMATDPSGMMIRQVGETCAHYLTSFAWSDTGSIFWNYAWKVCTPIYGSVPGSGAGGNGGGGGGGSKSPKPNPCDKLKAAGVTKGDWSRMVNAYKNMAQNNSNSNNVMQEYGFTRYGGDYSEMQPNSATYLTNSSGRGFMFGMVGAGAPRGASGLDFHTHYDPGPGSGYSLGPLNGVSNGDARSARWAGYSGANIMFLTGTATSLYQYDGNKNMWQIAGAGWWNLNCF